MKPARLRRLLVLTAGMVAGSTAVILAACGTTPSSAGPGSAGPGAGDGADSSSDVAAPETSADGDAGPTTPPPDADADAVADAAVWTPAQLDDGGNLALWLEPSAANVTVSNGTVTVWKDRSKNANDAKASSSGPTVHPALLAGNDTIHFETGTLLTIDDAPSLRFSTEQFYVASVARLIPGNGNAYLFSKTSTAVTGGGLAYASGFELWGGPSLGDAGAMVMAPSARIASQAGNQLTWSDPVFDDSKFHFVAVRRVDAMTLALTVDASAARTTATGSFSVDELGKSVRLGAFHYGNFVPTVDFDIAELVVVHGQGAVVSDVDVANVHAYLTRKYGL